MKLIFLILLSFACAEPKSTVYRPSPSRSPAPDLDAKYALVKDIIKVSCLTCHAGGKIVDLRSGATLAASKSRVRVGNGSMPPPDSSSGKAWNDSKRDKLLAFYD